MAQSTFCLEAQWRATAVVPGNSPLAPYGVGPWRSCRRPAGKRREKPGRHPRVHSTRQSVNPWRSRKALLVKASRGAQPKVRTRPRLGFLAGLAKPAGKRCRAASAPSAGALLPERARKPLRADASNPFNAGGGSTDFKCRCCGGSGASPQSSDFAGGASHFPRRGAGLRGRRLGQVGRNVTERRRSCACTDLESARRYFKGVTGVCGWVRFPEVYQGPNTLAPTVVARDTPERNIW